FSRRRRHTRFSRDWSSDVCSSDLVHVGGLDLVLELTGSGHRGVTGQLEEAHLAIALAPLPGGLPGVSIHGEVADEVLSVFARDVGAGERECGLLLPGHGDAQVVDRKSVV